jgi:hypothetical protein
MPNPKLLPCDSDVLVQLFLVHELRPLQELKKSFGIQATIVLEVDLELRWMAKYRDRFVPQLDRALKHGVLAKLDQSLFQSHLSASPPATSWGTFQSLGAQYYGYVQRGEAYTYAAAVTLGMPAVSNDFRAIQLLQFQMLSLPAPVLRCFDLLVFAHECGILTLKDCEKIRSDLLKRGEGIPKAFTHACFEDGLKTFRCRLKEGSVSGNALPSVPSFSDQLLIARI